MSEQPPHPPILTQNPTEARLKEPLTKCQEQGGQQIDPSPDACAVEPRACVAGRSGERQLAEKGSAEQWADILGSTWIYHEGDVGVSDERKLRHPTRVPSCNENGSPAAF